MRKLFYIALVLFFAGLVVPVVASANTIYTNANGTAESEGAAVGPCTTQANTASLANANSWVDAGDTVILCNDGGSYSTLINPSASPTQESERITYQGESGATVTFTAQMFAPSGKDYITIDGFTVDHSSRVIDASAGSNYIEVKNCDFSGAEEFSTVRIKNSSHWYFHDNVIGAAGAPGEYGTVSFDYNGGIIITNNTFSDGGAHGQLSLGAGGGAVTYVVVKDNTFRNTGVWTDEADSLDQMFEPLKGSSYMMAEGNTFYESGANYNDGKTGAIKIHEGSYIIIRRNIVYNMDYYAVYAYANSNNDGHSEYNTFYHNTFYNTARFNNALGTMRLYAYSENKHTQYNKFKNNIVSSSPERGIGFHADPGGGDDTYLHDNEFAGNWFYNIGEPDDVTRLGTTMTIDEAEDNYPAEFYGNSDSNGDGNADDLGDPKLVSPTTDFTLQSDSPCIDAAIELTSTNGTGSSSSTLIVDDASYFFTTGSPYNLYATWVTAAGLEDDTIYVNATVPFSVKITAINYSTNTLTLASSQTWQDGVEIYHCPGGVCFNGTAPDIGYSESGEASVPSNAIQGVSIN